MFRAPCRHPTPGVFLQVLRKLLKWCGLGGGAAEKCKKAQRIESAGARWVRASWCRYQFPRNQRAKGLVLPPLAAFCAYSSRELFSNKEEAAGLR